MGNEKVYGFSYRRTFAEDLLERMNILMLCTAFNSLSQRVFCFLKDRGHNVSVEFAYSAGLVEEAVKLWQPDLIVSPYLIQKVPQSVWEKVPVLIVHPGPIGDRGPSSLDWAVLKGVDEWGVTLFQANAQMDAGDIWAYGNFRMRKTSKGSIYRKEVSDLAIDLINEAIEKVDDPTFRPIPQSRICSEESHTHKAVSQSDRHIDWQNDDTETIIRKIQSADNRPGVLDEIMGVTCYLYGAHEEAQFRGGIKEVLAKRDGAICLGTKDGAVWISHLREPDRFKLPATYVLKERLKGVKERRIPLYVEPGLKTFKEITFTLEDRIGYLGFDFYNGAMNSEQCVRLKYAIETLRQKVDLLVLTGGENFFSNGIHLTILEDSKKQGEDGWSNINAINDLIKTILLSDNILTVASFGANAGAGGVFLGLACDFVLIRKGVVLNPHYKTIGLSGSEYHTYTLPKRVGEQMAQKLTEECLPISASRAEEIGMVDAVLSSADYTKALKEWCQNLIGDEERFFDLLELKCERIESDFEMMERLKEEELKNIYEQIWNPQSEFQRLRHDFVYKICSLRAPERIALHRKRD